MSEKTLNPHSSTQDHLKTLISLGLIIGERSKAADFLFRSDPVLLEKYLPAFMDKGAFLPGTTLKMIKEAYLFDQELRHILSLALEKVEQSFKLAYWREFIKLHEDTDYLNHSFYGDPIKHQKILDKGDKQRRSLSKHDPSFRYVSEDGSRIDLPIWDFVTLLTIKGIADLYNLSEKRIQENIAFNFGLKFKTRHKALGCMIHRLIFPRNLCAHGKRLYDFVFPQKACLSKKEEKLLPRQSDSTLMDSHLFAYILMLKRLLTKEDFKDFKNGVIALMKKYPSVDMRHYGFPSNWKGII